MTRGNLDIDDIVQETFIRVFRALGTFRGDSSFGTWVQRIAVNVSKSHIASRRRRLDTVSLDSSVADGPMLLHAQTTALKMP
jgi:RNA polymerase sigma-70 factor (ECF subfamily)